jgi:hypothetical protein
VHIEITYCQRNIPTSEMTLPAEKQAAKKRPYRRCRNNGPGCHREAGRAPLHHKARAGYWITTRTVVSGSRRMFKEMFLLTIREYWTINFREKAHKKKHFSDI